MSEDAVKLTSYFGERRRVTGGFAADALLDLYGRHEVAASILLRGAEGFGAKRHPRTDQSLTLSEDLPLTAVAVDSRSRIEPLVDATARITGTGLVTLERARLLRGDASRGETEPVALLDEVHEETKLTIYLGRQERVDRRPAFLAVCDLLHRRGAAGATALLGVDGTAHGQRERASFFSRNAGTPMMVVAVGSGARIGRVLPELGGLLRRPLLTLERVRICKRDGKLLCAPPALPGTDESGLPLWHKLMVYTSEAALHDGQPVHRAIIRRLRAAGLAGATTQRGLWGFHGDHAPHGDRLLQLGRRVPAVTIVIDSPERIALAFDIIDALTAEHGLVTGETVPAPPPGGDSPGQYVLRRLLRVVRRAGPEGELVSVGRLVYGRLEDNPGAVQGGSSCPVKKSGLTCPTGKRTRPRRKVPDGMPPSGAGTRPAPASLGWRTGKRSQTCRISCPGRTGASGAACSSISSRAVAGSRTSVPA